MEKVKYLPPKYSYAMKDLAEFLGFFEITEDQIKSKKSDGGLSDTSSNLSYVTQSAFMPKKSQLDVIREQVTHKEDEEGEDDEDSSMVRLGSVEKNTSLTNKGIYGQRARKGSSKMIKAQN
jgi:hypothetical protein